MSDYEDPPRDLFDTVCRLDDIAEWLADTAWPEEAAAIQVVSQKLKGYIEIRWVDRPERHT